MPASPQYSNRLFCIVTSLHIPLSYQFKASSDRKMPLIELLMKRFPSTIVFSLLVIRTARVAIRFTVLFLKRSLGQAVIFSITSPAAAPSVPFSSSSIKYSPRSRAETTFALPFSSRDTRSIKAISSFSLNGLYPCVWRCINLTVIRLFSILCILK